MKKLLFCLFCVILVLSAAVPAFAGGVEVANCPNCGKETDSWLGYTYDICEGGYDEFYCPNCDLTFRVEYPPRHQFGEGERHWTCSEGGYEIRVCELCGYSTRFEVAPRDHVSQYVETVQPTASKDGYFLMRCIYCSFETQERIPALSGSRSGGSGNAGLGISIGIGVALAGAGLFFLMKPKKKTGEQAATAPAKTKTSAPAAAAAAAAVTPAPAPTVELPKPKLSRKSVLWPESKNNRLDGFKDFLLRYRYLELHIFDMDAENAEETLLKEIPDVGPDMVLWVAPADESADTLKEKLAKIKEAYEDAAFGIVAGEKAPESLLSELKKMKDSGEILSFCKADDPQSRIIASLFLPMYKPEFSAEEGLDAVGKICDAFGIPAVSRAIELASEAKELKGIVKGGISLSGTVDLVSLVAGEMGWDKVSSITDFIDTFGETKALVKEEIDRQENK